MSARNSTPAPDPVARLLRLLAERLESFLDGDELAFETLGEEIVDEDFAAADLLCVIEMLRSPRTPVRAGGKPARARAARAAGRNPIGPPAGGAGSGPGPGAGRRAQRVASAEERATLSPEAWGYLLDLRRRGSLDDGQFERVLGILTHRSGADGRMESPVGVELAREVAAGVALGDGGTDLSKGLHGEADPIH